MRFSSKIVLRVAAIGVAAAAIGLPATAAQASTLTPATGSVTITPSTSLTNGESVTVSGTGFGDTEPVIISECSNPADQSTCVVPGTPQTATDNTGAFSASYTVTTGTTGTTGSCEPGDTCYIGAESFVSDPTAPDAQGANTITFAEAPTVVATPHTNVTNNEKLTITGTGFPDNMAASVVECSSLTAGLEGCNIATVVTPSPTTSATGTLSTSITVKTGKTGTGTCNAGQTCYIAVTTDPEDPTDTSQAGAAAIVFKAPTVVPPSAHATPNSGLKNKQTVTISGSHFPQHNQTLLLVECNHNLLKTGASGGQAACDTTSLNGNYKTSSTGTVKGAKFKVETGKVGNGTCGVGHACYIAVTTSFNGATADSAAAPISFGTAKSKTTAKASAKKVGSGKTFTISGAFKSGGKGIKDAKVVLYERAKGKKAWHKVKGYTTKAGGKFKTGKLKGPKHTEQYLVKHHKGSAGGFSYGASQSKIITVKK